MPAYVPSYGLDQIPSMQDRDLRIDFRILKEQEADRQRRYIDPTKRPRYDSAASYIEPISRELARREASL